MWKIGQKLVCKMKDWYGGDGCEPKYGEIVTFNGHCAEHKNHIDLVEYPLDADGWPQSFLKFGFEPLLYSGNAAKEILEKFQPTECKPDVIVKPDKQEA